ncbi:helix-turn-helix transcriptional regulator [Neorhizobium sp. IRAMC:178]|uniref:helix-turn-helix domain-containing protein n=1 Tax=Neorhizobium tunisiense TaxID=3144793 RepID=UPI0031F6152C
MNREIGEMLAQARDAAKKTQKDIAVAMSGNQTRISRLEAGEGAIDDALLYLAAIGTEEAEKLATMLQFNWRNLLTPSLRHPDIEPLMEIETALDRLRTFLADGEVPKVLAGQAELFLSRLDDVGRFLFELSHEIVYVGEIGAGKTTAACRQAGLVIDSQSASDLKGLLLDTGGGRTTLCDVRVETGDRYALTVDPVPDEEVYKLVSEVCRGIREKVVGETATGQADFKPSEEVERAVRNMAQLPRPKAARKGIPAAPDPGVELSNQYADLEEFTAEFASRLSLWRRSRRVIEFDGSDPREGRQWLKNTFTAINNGRHEEFTLPTKITVTVPFPLVPDQQLSVTLVDTRGVDGTAIRSDIIGHMKNQRAITLLCSKWGSAPDPTSQDLLQHVRETDSDPTLFARTAIVALARPGDAMSMRHDSGEAAEDVEEGYDIKQGQIETALQKIGLMGVKAFVYDAGQDDPQLLTDFVLDRIAAVRRTQIDAGKATISAIDKMFENLEQQQALAALELVNNDLVRFAERHERLITPPRPAHERLISAVRSLHARTVWAATTRAGEFWNFNVFQRVGDGAAAVAKVRSRKVLDGLIEVIASRIADPELESTHGFLAELLENANQWEADFVDASRHHAIAVYKAALSGDQILWDACEDPYGRGQGNYREHVANLLQSWFEEHDDLREKLDRRIARAWLKTFIRPLRQAAGQAEVAEL